MEEFQEIVREYYRHNKRELPWREEPFEQYHILVSEIMLQQTQVSRVIPKYNEFLKRFPNTQVLAAAPLSEVLTLWSGLGYNRRAKYLQEAAKQLQNKEHWNVDDLLACKGIGKNTAAAVYVYSNNEPAVFIETNIRTVFIHHFFSDRKNVDDKEIMPLVEECLDTEYSRDFYYALMDYGTYLKKSIGNTSRQSKHYTKQSRFDGSLRQIRGDVLRKLSQSEGTSRELSTIASDKRLGHALESLEKEGLIVRHKNVYSLPT